MELRKYKETILYLVFGVLSTIVNILVYVLATRNLNFSFLISNWIAWIAAVIFAYITNKFFVFESNQTDIRFIVKEFGTFVSCRVLSGVVEMIIMFLMINLLLINDFIVKLVTNIIVIILNFLFSKLFIFKRNINEVVK